MLETLLESKSRRTRGKGTALASAAFHITVILGAVYATASGASAYDAPQPPAKVHWVNSPPSRDPITQSPPARPSAPTNRVAIAAPLPVQLNIPVSLPPIDLNRTVVHPSDFPSPSRSTGDSPTNSGDPTGGGGGGVQAYDPTQVDSPVSMIGTFRPDYPAPLRSAGIEGQVVAQFVVTEAGKVDRESVKIISASNDVFASSVTSALARMRFTPARIGTHTVAQLVQQLFVFRLDR